MTLTRPSFCFVLALVLSSVLAAPLVVNRDGQLVNRISKVRQFNESDPEVFMTPPAVTEVPLEPSTVPKISIEPEVSFEPQASIVPEPTPGAMYESPEPVPSKWMHVFSDW